MTTDPVSHLVLELATKFGGIEKTPPELLAQYKVRKCYDSLKRAWRIIGESAQDELASHAKTVLTTCAGYLYAPHAFIFEQVAEGKQIIAASLLEAAAFRAKEFKDAGIPPIFNIESSHPSDRFRHGVPGMREPTVDRYLSVVRAASEMRRRSPSRPFGIPRNRDYPSYDVHPTIPATITDVMAFRDLAFNERGTIDYALTLDLVLADTERLLEQNELSRHEAEKTTRDLLSFLEKTLGTLPPSGQKIGSSQQSPSPKDAFWYIGLSRDERKKTIQAFLNVLPKNSFDEFDSTCDRLARLFPSHAGQIKAKTKAHLDRRMKTAQKTGDYHLLTRRILTESPWKEEVVPIVFADFEDWCRRTADRSPDVLFQATELIAARPRFRFPHCIFTVKEFEDLFYSTCIKTLPRVSTERLRYGFPHLAKKKRTRTENSLREQFEASVAARLS